MLVEKHRLEKKKLSRQRIVVVVGLYTLIVFGLLAYPSYRRYLAPWRQPVLRVNDSVFDMRYFVRQLRLYMPGSNVDTLAFSLQLLEKIQNDELIRQEAASLGLTLSPEEITREIGNRMRERGLGSRDFRSEFQRMLNHLGVTEAEYTEWIKTDLLLGKLKQLAAKTSLSTADTANAEGSLADVTEKALEPWLTEKAARGRNEGWIQWYWDSERYDWMMKHFRN